MEKNMDTVICFLDATGTYGDHHKDPLFHSWLTTGKMR